MPGRSLPSSVGECDSLECCDLMVDEVFTRQASNAATSLVGASWPIAGLSRQPSPSMII